MNMTLSYHVPADRFDLAVDGTFTLCLPEDGYPASISFDGVGYKDLARDVQDYAYTHGGREYRAACEAAWAEIERRAA